MSSSSESSNSTSSKSRSSSSKSSNKTYIGHIKTKNGGIKVIPGEKDNRILEKRNKILNHLEIVLSGGKSLKEKNISTYFKALGGKYIRNDICMNGDSYNCKGGQNISISGAHKLLKLSKNSELPMNKILETFKKSAPILYKKFESNIQGGKYSLPEEKIINRDYNNRDYNNRNYNNRDYNNNNNRDINRDYNRDYNNYRGGNDDIELIKLREEINQIRYSN
jgi:hypothetical protein